MDCLCSTEYFHHEDDAEEDDAHIEQYLSIEISQLPDDVPALDEFPFDEDRKMDSTLQNTEQFSKELPEENEPEPPIPHVSSPPGKIVFSQKTVDRYKAVFRGSKDDTVELNINFKTLLLQYFRELRSLKELQEAEVKQVEEFASRVPSFNSLMLFFHPDNPGIRQYALSLFSSQECIRRILLGRCRLKTKLQMIKFIEKMRLNILTQKGYKWKAVIKRTQ